MSEFGLLGIILIFIGLFVVVLGLMLVFWRRPRYLGRLPGDVNVKRGNVRFYFPIVTMLLISIVLTIVLNLILWLVRC